MPANPRSTASSTNTSRQNQLPNIVRDGLIGGVVAILLTVLPFSTVFGGGIAGYLQAKWEGGSWARAGGLAGGIAFIPHLIIGPYLIMVLAVIPPGLPPGYLLVSFLGFGLFYNVGLGVLGGLLGAYLRCEHISA